jgi:hypothetical protein
MFFCFSGQKSKKERRHRSLCRGILLFGGSSLACLYPENSGPFLMEIKGFIGYRQLFIEGSIFVVFENLDDFSGKSLLDKVSKLPELVSHDNLNQFWKSGSLPDRLNAKKRSYALLRVTARFVFKRGQIILKV